MKVMRKYVYLSLEHIRVRLQITNRIYVFELHVIAFLPVLLSRLTNKLPIVSSIPITLVRVRVKVRVRVYKG